MATVAEDHVHAIAGTLDQYSLAERIADLTARNMSSQTSRDGYHWNRRTARIGRGQARVAGTEKL